MRVLLLGPLILIFCVNCSQPQNTEAAGTLPGDSKLQGVTLQDTIVTVSRGGRSETFRIKRDLVHEIRSFLLVYHKFGDTLSYSFEDSVDITNSGRKNRYTTSIAAYDDGFLVSNHIWDHGAIIWYDTMLVNDRFEYYWDDSVFYALKPNSQFYIAYKYFSEFVSKPLDTTPDGGKSVIDHFLQYKSDSVYWRNEIANFNGRLVGNLSAESGGLYIWDKRVRRFIDFYQP